MKKDGPTDSDPRNWKHCGTWKCDDVYIEKHIPCSVHAKAAVLEAYNQDEKSLYYYYCWKLLLKSICVKLRMYYHDIMCCMYCV